MKGTSGAKKTSTSVEPTSDKIETEEIAWENIPVETTSTPKENNPDYTLDDVVSVAETGSLPPVESKSDFDTYMEQATKMYNQGVDTNNKNAENQAASAGAQYREVIRNSNELNKANGRANTGYAGDTSVDAYNAYRNSVNQSYSDANTANNELYSYYLSEMTRLQQADDEKETKVVTALEEIFENDTSYSNGYVSEETIEKAWRYATTIYGDNIPESIIAYLETKPGYRNWREDSNSYSDKYSDNFIRVEDSVLQGSSEGLTVGDDEFDDFYVKYDGEDYELETRRTYLTDSEINTLNKLLDSQHGSMCVFKGKLYVRTESGGIMQAVGRDGNYKQSNELLIKIKNKQNSKVEK